MSEDKITEQEHFMDNVYDLMKMIDDNFQDHKETKYRIYSTVCALFLVMSADDLIQVKHGSGFNSTCFSLILDSCARLLDKEESERIIKQFEKTMRIRLTKEHKGKRE